MQNEKNKQSIEALWKKYQHTLELLADALERLERKPKEVEIPVTEFVEVPKIVEKEKIVDLSKEQREQYELKILKLEQEIANLKNSNKNIDYWGRPKTPSKHLLDNQTAEQKLEERYKRLVNEVRSGNLNINTLTHAEAEIVNRLLNE